MVQRFILYHRITHGIIIVSFLGLVLTGLPLLYSHTLWASWLYRLLGGYPLVGYLHRGFALGVFLYASLHLVFIFCLLAIKKQKGVLWGPDSLVPRPKDLQDFLGDLKWMIGRGQRPRFDRWTYWQKFYYWADYWGVTIIGSTGLALWFPAFFTKFTPKWFMNVALLVHGEEALMAALTIFLFHFFHMHLRPEKFPVDRVMFTGRITHEDMMREFPLYYARLVADDRLKTLEISPLSRRWEKILRWVWVPPVAIGGLVLLLMIWGSVR